MNTNHSNSIVDQFRHDEARVLDRLVDDELSADQRRELLAALDDEPGAWRRCALAFLEAQAWRGQLSRLAVEPVVAAAGSAGSARIGNTTTAGNATASRSGVSRGAFWGASLAIAASLLVAFVLGVKFQNAGPQLAGSETPPTGHPTVPLAVQPLKGNESIPAGNDETDEMADAAADAESASPSETITLALDGSDDKIQLPVVTAAGGAEGWLASNESALSADLLRQLQQAGFEVTRQQRLWPVELSDGRKVVVPVEEVDIRSPESLQF